MIVLTLSVLACGLAAMQAGLFFKNLPLFYRRLDTPESFAGSPPRVSVLIPARDEAAGIGESLRSILASESVDLEIIVMDDHSTDATADIVNEISASDPRVSLRQSDPLPAGWNGKQHACAQLAEAATHQRLVFLDADVRLLPQGLAKLIDYQDRTGVDLLSAFPRQVMGTTLEKWLIPMMHYVLLCFLPFDRMRASRHPAYSSGCGQLFLTKLDAYHRAGTHAAIHASRHDGLKLPKAYRTAKMTTDVIDGTEVAYCRMYTSAQEVIRGVLKNADEGIANPKLIVPFTIMLLGSVTLPVLLVARTLWSGGEFAATALSITAITLSHLPRARAAMVFRQSWIGVLFHSVSVTLFVLLQWIALVNRSMGKQIAWRGRVETQPASTT
tara:strand:- start:114975 stop:116129 length:1155 start_codon:yes stop_codon:yes gene_type:complete